jgi:hypothetical protein
LVFIDIVTQYWAEVDLSLKKSCCLDKEQTQFGFSALFFMGQILNMTLYKKDGNYSFSIWQELACKHADP